MYILKLRNPKRDKIASLPTQTCSVVKFEIFHKIHVFYGANNIVMVHQLFANKF